MNGDWAEVMISTSPSARAVAMAVWVSIGTCCTGGFWKRNSKTRSASAKPSLDVALADLLVVGDVVPGLREEHALHPRVVRQVGVHLRRALAPAPRARRAPARAARTRPRSPAQAARGLRPRSRPPPPPPPRPGGAPRRGRGCPCPPCRGRACSGRSAPVSTAFTPGIACAFDVSMRLMRAAACGEVRMRACSMPGRRHVVHERAPSR